MCPLGQVKGRYLNMSHTAPKCLATVLVERNVRTINAFLKNSVFNRLEARSYFDSFRLKGALCLKKR
jgi:hypothetical protein